MEYGKYDPQLTSASGILGYPRKEPVQKEIVTVLFDSMLHTIVKDWEPKIKSKSDTILQTNITPNLISEQNLVKKKKTSTATAKSIKLVKKRSKEDLSDTQSQSESQTTLTNTNWWNCVEEDATVYFENGNIYEGTLYMKCMHGLGRFKWADGTVFEGQFVNNEIWGNGVIHWKNDTWYEGDFVNNLRHGHGLFVNSRQQQCYSGDWYCGTKHGQGVIHYSSKFDNYYDGEWELNMRHGFGVREYNKSSEYTGQWFKYVRNGEGLMIWPNQDIYKGEWDDGTMVGFGMYIWETLYNTSLSLSAFNIYRGLWKRGQRNGYGILDLGLGGAHYKGEFKDNKKHGKGKFITNNGLMLYDKELFVDDNLKPMTSNKDLNFDVKVETESTRDFNMRDNYVDLLYHIQEALRNIDNEKELRSDLLNDYFEKNNISIVIKYQIEYEHREEKIEDMIEFEEILLRKCLLFYHNKLRNIYYMYATMCNDEEIHFQPILIRLFLWQLYYDCKVHEKLLTLVEIDRMFHQNSDWLSRNPHDPFEKIHFWQFLHSLLSVANKLYAKRCLPAQKPDTILAKAFTFFMDNDLLPHMGEFKGKLTKENAKRIPMKPLYKLYRSLGEPHTVRTFLCATHYPPHLYDHEQPPLIDDVPATLHLGCNMYVIGDQINYVMDDQQIPNLESATTPNLSDLKLFNFGNLSIVFIINNIFSKIFPQITDGDIIMDLNVEMTFFEFFQAFVTCVEESIKCKLEEELEISM